MKLWKQLVVEKPLEVPYGVEPSTLFHLVHLADPSSAQRTCDLCLPVVHERMKINIRGQPKCEKGNLRDASRKGILQ